MKHTLSIAADNYGVELDLVCRSSPVDACRLSCEEDCETWNFDDHGGVNQHNLSTGECNAVQQFKLGDYEMYENIKDGVLISPLWDGADIEVEFNGDVWEWWISPVEIELYCYKMGSPDLISDAQPEVLGRWTRMALSGSNQVLQALNRFLLKVRTK